MQIRDTIEKQQDERKQYAEQYRKPAPEFNPGDQVYLIHHLVRNAVKGTSTKHMPCRRDGPFVLLSQRFPPSYEIAILDGPQVLIGVKQFILRCFILKDTI
ncbi:hypothetical protein CDAR_26651 [Caerostris darwini]|uniref:Uncharacterized protein n=1 Tax=Caerostris darwini TaxID=1538125 RepID=A0AAV4P767_9ARAC|nr:hypothetical protein CDAR_26651 [Caerostris darwini]